MPVTDEQLAAQRGENAALRKELQEMHAALSVQSVSMQNVEEVVNGEVEAVKSVKIADIARSHDVALRSCELGFSQQLEQLGRSMQLRKSELDREDAERRQQQLASKRQIEAAYKERISALKTTLGEKESEIQSGFQAVTNSYQQEMDGASADCERLEKAETKLLARIEQFADKQQEIDLVHQRAEFETQMAQLRADYRARIAKFEEQSAELLSAKQLFFEERLAVLRQREEEEQQARAEFERFAQETLEKQEKVYEADLVKQEAFLQQLLEKDVRARVELERMNAEEARKLGMREDREAWRAQIARMRAEMP